MNNTEPHYRLLVIEPPGGLENNLRDRLAAVEGNVIELKRSQPEPEAVESARTWNPDALLFVHSSGADSGIDLLRGELSTRPAIFLVDHWTAEIEAAARASGAAEVVAYDELCVPALKRVMREALAGTRSPALHLEDQELRGLAQEESLIANVRDAIVGLNSDMVVTAWNRAAEEMYGWKAREAIGKKLADVVRSKALPGKIAQSLKTYLRGGPYQVEMVQYNREGEPLVVEMIGTALYDDQGNITGYILANRNVTERRRQENEREQLLQYMKDQRIRAEQLAVEAERRANEIDGLFNALTDAVLLFGLERRLVRSNKIAARLLGFDPGNMTAGELFARIRLAHADGTPVDKRELPYERVERGEAVINESCQLTGEGGQQRWISLSAAPVFSRRQLTGVVVVLHDVTEREALAAQLEAERARLSTIFANAPQGIVLTDEKGQIILANPMAESMYLDRLLYRRENGLGRKVEILHPDGSPFQPEDLPLTRSALNGETQINLEMMIRAPGSRPRYLLVSAAPILDRKGRIRGAVGVFQDMTERRQLMEDVIRSSGTIEAQHYLTRLRERENLRIAHALHNGPLQGLISVGYKLSEIRLMSNEPEVIAQLREANMMVQELVHDVRTFTDSLRPPVLGHFGLDRAIHSYVNDFMVEHPDIEVELDLDKDGRRLPETTRLALFRVLKELMNNIIAHAQATHVRISFAVDEQEVRLTVEDNGTGFRPPSQWVELARSGHYGLVNLREQTESIGGTMQVNSKPGEGTQVMIRVPKPVEAQEEELT